MPTSKALLVIDYSYDFASPDGKLTAGVPAQNIERALIEKIKAFHQSHLPIFFMMDLHYENDTYHPETRLFPPHNIEGSVGRELYGKVKSLYESIKDAPHVFFIDKSRYSSFSGTNLNHLLRERHIDTVVLSGLVTDICIMHTAVDAYNLGYNIIVPKSCVASFNETGHTYSLNHFKTALGATIED